MKITIYQINSDKDVDKLRFCGSDYLNKNNYQVDPKIYNIVYTTEHEYKNLEEFYTKFNINKPDDYHGRSLSVSDVVLVDNSNSIDNGAYFCDSFGFNKLDNEIYDKFKSLSDETSTDTIKAVIVEPNKPARIEQINNSLEELQKIVGGYIEVVYPFEDEVALICNEEGKFTGLPLNRALRVNANGRYSESADIVDVLAGTFLIVLAPSNSENFESLTNELADKYNKIFYRPEKFLKTEFGIISIKR